MNNQVDLTKIAQVAKQFVINANDLTVTKQPDLFLKIMLEEFKKPDLAYQRLVMTLFEMQYILKSADTSDVNELMKALSIGTRDEFEKTVNELQITLAEKTALKLFKHAEFDILKETFSHVADKNKRKTAEAFDKHKAPTLSKLCRGKV